MSTPRTLSTLRAHNPYKIGYESSIYYYWFEFLKRSEPSSRSKRVLEDFGDITDVKFMDWWRYTGQKLFLSENIDDYSEFPTMGVIDIETAQESLDLGRFMVSINMNYPKKVIMERLKSIVDNQVNAKVGRRELLKDRGGKYNMKSKFDVYALKRTLEVYDLSIKKEEPKLTRWEIEERLNLIDKTSKKAGAVWKMGKTPKELATRRKVQTATVSRYLRHAGELIKNVAQGEFPIHS
jgi:hypothetical protein